jgi:hypothetical protein
MVAVRTSVCLWNIPLFTITSVKIRKFNLFSYKIFVSVRDPDLLILEPIGPVILEIYAICLSMCLSVWPKVQQCHYLFPLRCSL